MKGFRSLCFPVAAHVALVVVFLFSLFAAVPVSAADDPAALKRRIGQADYYLREFEKEVERQRGGEKAVWRNKQDALQRVQALKSEYPDDPDVEALFQRTRKALMKSKGDFVEIDPAWTVYLRNEENLRKQIAAIGKEKWESLLAACGTNLLESAYPTPDSERVTVEDLAGKCVVLEDVEYPRRQFYGATGEYIACGKPSTGFWFLRLGTRDWLGPYEAVKRCRRLVDATLTEVPKWTVLARIEDVTAENPNPGEDPVGEVVFGWVLRPLALYVPGHVLAVPSPGAEHSGLFAGEDRVETVKEGWYTVKAVPADVTPERLMEIFLAAIKEKNYALYTDCIDPQRRRGDIALDQLRYHWDLHQERLHGEYVHATFGKAVVTVRKGFDDANDLENFFLDDEQRATLKKVSGEKVEEAVVESRAWDANGHQLGSPHPHRLIRRDGGRWYVEDYGPRF